MSSSPSSREELPMTKSSTKQELEEGARLRKQKEREKKNATITRTTYVAPDFDKENDRDKEHQEEQVVFEQGSYESDTSAKLKKEPFYIRYVHLIWSKFMAVLLSLSLFLKFINEKCGVFFVSKGRMEEKWTVMEALPFFLRRKGNSIFVTLCLLFLAFAAFKIYKAILKEVWHEEYTDRWNNTIIDPLHFVDTSDPENIYPNPELIVFDDHYNQELVSWISNQNIKGERKLTKEELESGQFKSKIFGLGEEDKNISFELLKKALIYYSDRFDGCISGKNLGIPVDILYLNMNPEITRARFMLQPEIVAQASQEFNASYTVEVRNGPGSVTHIQHKEVVPREIRVDWMTIGIEGKAKKFTDKFSDNESLCIWYQVK
jgi:hypothetical protein